MDMTDEGEIQGIEQQVAPKISKGESPFKVGKEEKAFTFKAYTIAPENKEAELWTPGEMVTGDLKDVYRTYGNTATAINKVAKGRYVNIPYSYLHGDGDRVYGDYSTARGQDEFKDIDLSIDTHPYNPTPWAADLWRFARLKLARPFKYEDTIACLRGLETHEGKMKLTVGPAMYSDSFYSMGAEGVVLGLTPAEREALANRLPSEHMAELEQLLDKLTFQYGAGNTLRHAVALHTDNQLPDYNGQTHAYALGVAGTVLTNDGDVVFVRRGSGVSVNRGINVTASGGVKFNADALSQYGLPTYLGRQMADETQEELGLNGGTLLLGAMREKIKLELGIEDPSEYDLTPVGWAREWPRGGSPEVMFQIDYKGSTDQLVDQICNNTHADKREIDQQVLALPLTEATSLIGTEGADSVIQHKGILNILLINEHNLKRGNH
jgi:hypothetical protein